MIFSRSGVSSSIGSKGFRITKTARGRTRTTLSVPGTGLSHVSEGGRSRGEKATSSRRPAKSISGPTKNERPVVIDIAPKRPVNSPKPPKSPKIYRPCGIILVILGLLMLFLLWPLGLFAIGIGIYYITSGPKIYANAVARYKAVHPEFEENP